MAIRTNSPSWPHWHAHQPNWVALLQIKFMVQLKLVLVLNSLNTLFN